MERASKISPNETWLENREPSADLQNSSTISMRHTIVGFASGNNQSRSCPSLYAGNECWTRRLPYLPNPLLAVFVLLLTVECLGQTYSTGIYAGGVTYYSSSLVFGSPPYRFGLEEYSYSTDAAGYIIMYSPTRGSKRGDTAHRYTRVLLGPLSFSVPLGPTAVATIGSGLIILGVGFCLAAIKARKYKGGRDETAKV